VLSANVFPFVITMQQSCNSPLGFWVSPARTAEQKKARGESLAFVAGRAAGRQVRLINTRLAAGLGAGARQMQLSWNAAADRCSGRL
jgi:hypothetical protein